MSRNTLLRVVNTIAGCSSDRSNAGNCAKLKTLQFRESNLGNLQAEKGNIERKKSVAEFEEGNVLINNRKIRKDDKELEDPNKRMKNDLGGSEFKDFIIDPTRSQQAIDNQIDRLGGEFRKNESSEDIHALEREEYRDADELGEMLQ